MVSRRISLFFLLNIERTGNRTLSLSLYLTRSRTSLDRAYYLSGILKENARTNIDPESLSLSLSLSLVGEFENSRCADRKLISSPCLCWQNIIFIGGRC